MISSGLLPHDSGEGALALLSLVFTFNHMFKNAHSLICKSGRLML